MFKLAWRFRIRQCAILGLVLLLAGILAYPKSANAEDHVHEYAQNLCAGEPPPSGTQPIDSDFGLSFYGDEFEVSNVGQTASFHAEPIGFTYGISITRLIVTPDSQTDVGNGPGQERSYRLSHFDGSWFIDGTYYPGAPPITVKGFDDADDTSEHQSTIHFAAECSSSVEEKIMNFCTVMDIRVRYEGEEPPEARQGFRNTCPQESSTPAAPTARSAPNSTIRSKSAQQPTPTVTESLAPDVYLNELEGYIKGIGEVLWLKPGEGARFTLGPEAQDGHTLRVKSITDNQSTIVVSSDPIELTLANNQARAVDTNRDGQNDIEITMLGVADGQAGLRVKPLTKAAAKPSIKVPALTTKVRYHPWPYLAGGAAIIALLGGAWFGRRFVKKNNWPSAPDRTSVKKQPNKSRKRP